MRPPGTASPSAKLIQGDEIPLAVMTGRMKKFSENTSTIPEVMDSSTLNCSQIISFHDFLARDSMLSALYAIANPYFCLSVTWVDQSKTVEVRIMKFSPYSSPIPLVF